MTDGAGTGEPAPEDLSRLQAWSASANEVLRALRSDPVAGLSAADAARRLTATGPNVLRARARKSVIGILVEQFRSVVILLLLAAATLAYLFAEPIEAAAIVAVVFINAAIGFMTEWRATRSMEALGKLARTDTVVIRDGKSLRLSAELLVPGDVVMREGGDVVTADMRLIEAAALQADESALTGESLPVDKVTGALPTSTPLADRNNMLFKGTSVVRGSGKAVVVATGLDTELGQISELVREAAPEQTPLEKRLDQLAGRLVRLVVVFSVFLAVAGALVGEDVFLAVEVAIALAVAAIPEGLPIVATIALARGMWRMARRNALISRLSAVETLGATSVILTDKTGTLTENRMQVVAIEIDGQSIGLPEVPDAAAARVDEMLRVASLCGNAELAEPVADAEATSVGDPTELALLRAARLRGVERRALLREWPEVEESSFDPSTKLMATVHEKDGRRLVAVKGAPESVINRAAYLETGAGPTPMTAALREDWLGRAQALGVRGLRTLAIAVRRDDLPGAGPYDELQLIGLVGIEDPARAGIRESINRCVEAGMRVVMLTGDHPATARKIAEDVGIVAAGVGGDACIRGEELTADLLVGDPDRVAAASVFSRMTPQQKLALIGFYQSRNCVVAMTGDGINDAPALKKADIGIAMGIRGSAVARESAAMILQDDEFSTIVEAVRQGRAIYENIRKFVVYLLSCNISEVLVVTLATIAGAPLPLLPLQILFLNLVTDVFPALALGVGEGDERLMQDRPRPADEPLLTQPHWVGILLYGLLISLVVLASMAVAIYGLDLTGQHVVTVSFCTLGLAQVWHVFNMHRLGNSFAVNEVTRNPWVWAAVALCVILILLAVNMPTVADVLQLSSPGPAGWAVIAIMSLLPVLCGPWVRAAGERFRQA